MLTVWIHSPSLLIAKALGEVISSLGYRVQFEEDPKAELALWDLTCCEQPYAPAPSVPALALLNGCENDLTLQDVLALGYRGILQGGDVGDALKRALESLALEGQAA